MFDKIDPSICSKNELNTTMDEEKKRVQRFERYGFRLITASEMKVGKDGRSYPESKRRYQR
jgi:hypothetical protein